jgi:hypothetical protein
MNPGGAGKQKTKKSNIMAFQKGNDLWKIAQERGTIGRNRIFQEPEQMQIAINEYFEYMKDQKWIKKDFIKSGPDAGQLIDLPTQTPMTIQSFCLFLGVHTQYFSEFIDTLNAIQNKEKAHEFSVIITRAMNVISNQKLEGAMTGAYNPMIVARIEGLKEKTDITSNDQQITGITVTREEAKRIAEQLENDI